VDFLYSRGQSSLPFLPFPLFPSTVSSIPSTVLFPVFFPPTGNIVSPFNIIGPDAVAVFNPFLPFSPPSFHAFPRPPLQSPGLSVFFLFSFFSNPLSASLHLSRPPFIASFQCPISWFCRSSNDVFLAVLFYFLPFFATIFLSSEEHSRLFMSPNSLSCHPPLFVPRLLCSVHFHFKDSPGAMDPLLSPLLTRFADQSWKVRGSLSVPRGCLRILVGSL